MTTGALSMADYISEVEHAVSSLLNTVWSEREAFDRLVAKHESLLARVQAEYHAAEQIAAYAEDADDVMMATGRQWDNYFGPDKEQDELRKDVSTLETQVEVHRFSVSSLAGGLLQIAKQGLSIVHQQRPSALGRSVGSQQLSDVIWEARNQAIHWEEGHLNARVQSCFQALETDFGPQFADFQQRSMASEVLDVLGWKSFDDFSSDMLTVA